MASLSAPAMARSRHAASFRLSHFIARHGVALCCGVLLVLALWLGFAIRDHAAPLRIVAGLDEPLVATAATSAQEDAALDAALLNFRRAPPEADFPPRAEPLIAFVAAHPHSPWRAAILTNLGIGYYRAGYFSKALVAWEQAWQAGRHARDPAARALADRAVGELARMYARLGHAEALQALLDDIVKRPVSGPATELLAGAREGLWAFRNDHGKAYLCGPMALRSLLARAHAPASALELMNAQRSGPRGFDLAQLSALAERAALPHRLIHRTPGEPIPVPSVVHWKLDHYAAIVDEQDGRYLVQDPTFASGDAWLTRAAIDAEASGHFLVPQDASSDAHWRSVSPEEARSIHGMGYTTNNEPGNTLSESLGLHEPSCNRMCESNAKTMLVSLHLSDVPVGYTPPKGPPAQVRLSCHQRESGRPAVFGFFNIGPKWTLSVQSWIEDDPARPGVGVVRHAGGGGFVGPLDYGSYSGATGAFSPERVSRAVLVRLPASGAATSYELRQPDGSKQVFAQPDGATSVPRRMFLTQVVDPAGNALTLHYDAQLRLASILDATGRSTTFTYGLASSPLLVTRITDPFGRHADLGYDAQGRLASITDVIGITSSFSYDAKGLVDTMTTPYGTSRFSQGEDAYANTRFLEITDAMGFTERVEFRHSAPGIASSDPKPPQVSGGLLNDYLQYRNTFYWDKHASAVAPGDYTAARITHWLHDANGQTSPIPESTKAPLEGRVWSFYPGQPNTIYEGASGVANQVAGTLDDGSTQRWAYEHNALGKPLSIRDPAGRVTRFTYAANDIDLIAVRQQVGAGTETLASAIYDARHRPLSVTDAAGSTTRYAYNQAGQPTAVTDALGQTTRYEYDDTGRLIRIVHPDGSTRLTLAYDGFDRIASATNSEGSTQTYQYDALDRLTRIGYPDGSSVEHSYQHLDRVATKDRLGRVTRYGHDANRRLIALTDPMGQVTAYAYHRNGVLRSITDPKGNTTAWDIDVQGRPTAKRHADGSTETYAHEPLSGRLSTVTDARGQSKVLAYAVDDRLASVSYPNAGVPTAGVSFAHDSFFPRPLP
jgi:YD repeat-containing protein